jgi:hypothetical protein
MDIERIFRRGSGATRGNGEGPKSEKLATLELEAQDAWESPANQDAGRNPFRIANLRITYPG